MGLGKVGWWYGLFGVKGWPHGRVTWLNDHVGYHTVAVRHVLWPYGKEIVTGWLYCTLRGRMARRESPGGRTASLKAGRFRTEYFIAVRQGWR